MLTRALSSVDCHRNLKAPKQRRSAPRERRRMIRRYIVLQCYKKKEHKVPVAEQQPAGEATCMSLLYVFKCFERKYAMLSRHVARRTSPKGGVCDARSPLAGVNVMHTKRQRRVSVVRRFHFTPSFMGSTLSTKWRIYMCHYFLNNECYAYITTYCVRTFFSVVPKINFYYFQIVYLFPP